MTPTFDNGVVRFYQGDVRDVLRDLPTESVQTCVTSPPYWGLRDYGLPPLVWGGDEGCEHEWGEESYQRRANDGGKTEKQLSNAGANSRDEPIHHAFCACGAWRGSLGLEPTIDLYVAHMVDVFREVKRVLRDDGTVWLNLGDSYAANRGSGSKSVGEKQATNVGALLETLRVPLGLKEKDLCGIPWRIAFALQADGAASPEAMRVVERVRSALLADFDSWEAVPDKTRSVVESLEREWADAHKGGWWLRSDIVWSKPNPMPESVTDRPTRSHEYVFLLSKSARYYYDAEAIREPHTGPSAAHYGVQKSHSRPEAPDDVRRWMHDGQPMFYNPAGRNKRTVWEIATEPYPDAHFATFPQKVVEPCILAGTPAKGSCSECGAPWERVVEKEYLSAPQYKDGKDTLGEGTNRNVTRMGDGVNVTTTGWRPTCDHDAEPEPALVLDPFVGSGTTAFVAQRLGRRAIGIDLSAEYLELAVKRLRGQTLPMALT